ncbi:type II toxin-antitoxin system VapC family toxin [Paraburkholderia gardini]|uniref:type II toxin-antitoxin system VapC family toxin n=1 Tax=Paraburkholderia gardini TaxID=2823469 RepID=UPI001DB8F52D|nr:type II toxin-antitoxin system VapC family toxin [Paraburkholderia gardini]CAG4927256.1 tRNA(fMet)-specific endonuclease VapC [Paraburkholderia gardini]
MAAIIVDTCVWIDVANGSIDLDAVLHQTGSDLVYVSAMTIGELEYGAQIPNDAMERAQRMSVLRQVEQMPVLEITRQTAQSFGLLATLMRQAGRNPRPRYNDLWIASQAHEHGYAVLTSNPDDYQGLGVIRIITAPKTKNPIQKAKH